MPSCIGDALRQLAASPRGCLIREDLSQNSSKAIGMLLPRFPVYVLHAPWLLRRHNFMQKQLVGLTAADVTWVTCANRGDVDSMSPAMRHCAYPCVQMNRYAVMNKTTDRAEPLANGTVSLALKHKLAAYDILQRGLTAALVLEDDAVLPPDLWTQLARLQLPRACQLFWMGSYSSRTNVGTLADHPRIADNVHRRDASRGFPVILGAVGYVLFRSGAQLVASEPVTTAADIAISLFPRVGVSHQARGTSASLAPPRHGHNLKDKPFRSYEDGTCEDDSGVRYVQRTPTEQAGPKQWILWPVGPGEQLAAFGDHGGTHDHPGG